MPVRDTGAGDSSPAVTRAIAVMPFHNTGADGEGEVFGDGLTEDIINELAQDHELNVIPRAAVFTYKGTPVKVQDVSRATAPATCSRGASARRETACG